MDEKGYSKAFSLRIPMPLREKLEKKAEKEIRPLGNLIVHILSKAVDDEKRGGAA